MSSSSLALACAVLAASVAAGGPPSGEAPGAGSLPATPKAAVVPPSPAAQPGPYDPRADAAADLRAAGTLAGTRGMRVLAIVGGNWCGWCRALDRMLAGDAELSSTVAARFVVVHVNVSKENRNEAILESLGRPDKLGFPALVVLSPSLGPLRIQETGTFESGDKKSPGHDRGKVLAFLLEWGPARS